MTFKLEDMRVGNVYEQNGKRQFQDFIGITSKLFICHHLSLLLILKPLPSLWYIWHICYTHEGNKIGHWTSEEFLRLILKVQIDILFCH